MILYRIPYYCKQIQKVMAKKKKSKKVNSTQTEKKIERHAPAPPLAHDVAEVSPLWGWFFAGLAVVLYINTLWHQYAFDDSIVITGNEFTKQGFAGIYDLMTRDFFEGIYGDKGMDLTGGRYRPLSLVMFAIEYQFFGLNPVVGHFVNILLYAMTGFFLFKTLLKWLDNQDGTLMAILVTLVFVVHPIHTEVVANIKSRDEILSLLLTLFALDALYRVINEDGGVKWTIIACVSYFMAMLAKETAFVFLALFPLTVFVLQDKNLNESIKASFPLMGTAVFYMLMRSALVGAPGGGGDMADIMENPFYGVETAYKLGTIGVILLHYFLLLLFPHPLSSDYSREQIPLVSIGDVQSLLGWGLYIAIGIYAAVKIWKKDVVALSVLYYLAPLSLVCNLFFNIGAPMADRFLYFSSLGFAMAVGYGIVTWLNIHTLEQLKKNVAVVGLLGVVVALFSFKTITRNKDWYDNATLFAKDIHASPNSAKMQYYYANSLLKKYLDNPAPTDSDKTILAEAEKHFLRSHEINPNFVHATYNLGLVNVHQREAKEALKWLTYTIGLEEHHGKSHEQLVRVYGELLNKPQKAMEHLNFVLQTAEGQNASNYQHLGILHAMQGKLPEAEKAFLKSIDMDPGNAKYYQNLGGLYMQMGNTPKANEYFEKAYQLNPSLRPQ